MDLRKITSVEFAEQFKVKEYNGQWDCYGTWNGSDMYELADTPENARISMWNRLTANGWAYTEREEALIKLSHGCYWHKETPNLAKVSANLNRA